MRTVTPYANQAPAAARRYSLRANPALRLSEHFRLVEFASRDGADGVLVHPALVELLEAIRTHFDRPVIINSGYRTPSHNAAIGGAKQSRHVLGMAADIVVRGVDPDDVADYADELGAGGVGRYPTFVHVDVQGAGRRWDFR